VYIYIYSTIGILFLANSHKIGSRGHPLIGCDTPIH
jgi:hypothetical protein